MSFPITHNCYHCRTKDYKNVLNNYFISKKFITDHFVSDLIKQILGFGTILNNDYL